MPESTDTIVSEKTKIATLVTVSSETSRSRDSQSWGLLAVMSKGQSSGSPAAMSEAAMPQYLIRFIRGWDTCVSGGVPLVSGSPNQPVRLTIRRRRSCCVHGEMDVTARWQHTPIYRSPNVANFWGAIHSQQYPKSPKPDAVHRGVRRVHLWSGCTLKPENLTHSLHSPRSSMAGIAEVAER